MSNLVVDKTPITSENFNTSLYWTRKLWLWMARFLRKWNYRSVSPSPSHGEDSAPLKGRYDFDLTLAGI